MGSIEDMGRAAIRREAFDLRMIVMDLLRDTPDLAQLPAPLGATPQELAASAAIIELLASRRDQAAPKWIEQVPSIATPFHLLASAETMPRLRKLCEEEGPLPLRRRGFYAPPDFLTFA